MPEFVLSIVAGLHVPVKPLDDVVGNAGTLPPSQMVREVPILKAGVILGATVIENVTVGAQLTEGVNV